MGRRKSINNQDVLVRQYEYGKMEMARYVDAMLKDALESNEGLKSFAKAFRKRFQEYVPTYGKSKPSKFEMKFNYLETYEYRGVKVDVFDDDYGQQYYFFLNGASHGCGAYNMMYQECIQYEVDRMLDHILDYHDFGDDYFGASLDYSDHVHSYATLRYRGNEICTFHPIGEHPFEDDIEEVKARCRSELDRYIHGEGKERG